MRGQDEEDKEEEDKEQCSPVSVLDPLEEEEEEEDHHQREPDHINLPPCSFEVVQRESLPPPPSHVTAPKDLET